MSVKSVLDVKQTATQSTVPMWIDGHEVRVESARRGNVCNPATGRVIRTVPFGAAAEIGRAVAAAERAFGSWRAVTPLNRARILMRFKTVLEANLEPLAHIISEEHGKTLADAKGSVQRGIEVVEFAAGAPHLLKGEHATDVGRGVDCHSRRQALGVCAGITPFNFPVMVPLWMFPLAIVCGNTFVLKPSEKVPSASIRLAQLFQEAGLPEGVLNVVHGDREAVDELLAHPAVRAVSFVGSTAVAQHVYATAAKAGKRVQALGGAKNHAIVLPDADMAAAADALVGAAFGSAGQRCMAISAVIAVGDTGDALVETLKQKGQQVRVGAGTEPGVEMCPLISAEQRLRVDAFVDAGVREGATLVLDGRGLCVEGYEQGFFAGPTIFDHVSPAMTIYQNEIFGPVLVVLRAASLEAAIGIVNGNPYGNGTALFTRDGRAARAFEDRVEVGMVGVNVAIPVPMAFFSFGGWKSSLFGDLHVYGQDSVSFYTRTKVITSRWPEKGGTSATSLSMPVMT